MIQSPSILVSNSENAHSFRRSLQISSASTSIDGDVVEEFPVHSRTSQCSSPQTYEYHKNQPSNFYEGKQMYHLGAKMDQQSALCNDEESAVDFQVGESTYENNNQDSTVQIKEQGNGACHLGGYASPMDEHFESRSETDGEDEKVRNYGDISQRQSLCSKIMHECFRFLCPCAVLLRALCRCEFGLFWKMCSSIFVIKGFWSSTISLGVCTLFKVTRIVPNLDSDVNSNSTEAYLFGLWTYTDKIIEENHSIQGYVEGEIARIETCSFHMQRVDEDAPDGLFLNDAAFTIARVFAVMTLVIGCISMVSVWLTAANVLQSCCGGKRQWLLPSALAMCCVMESFVFLIFASSVCRDTKYDEHRQCTLQTDSGMIFASITSYLITAVATVMMYNTPPEIQLPDKDGDDDFNSLDMSSAIPGKYKTDKTFEDSEDSSSDGEVPSRFEIS